MKIRFALLTLLAAATLSVQVDAQAPAQTAPQTKSTQTTPAATAPSANAPAAPKGRVSAAQTAAAPGGGPGMVWVNTASKVYHCSGTTYYGKTKAGKYATEEAAKAEGDRPNGGKPCAK